MALKKLPNEVQSLLCASAQINSFKRAMEELVSYSIYFCIHLLSLLITIITILTFRAIKFKFTAVLMWTINICLFPILFSS